MAGFIILAYMAMVLYFKSKYSIEYFDSKLSSGAMLGYEDYLEDETSHTALIS